MSLDGGLQMSALARLLAAVAFDVGRARLAHNTAVRALRDWAALLVDVLEGAVCIWLAIGLLMLAFAR